ncbi:MAG TPA: DNA-processing protein DprA [Flavisolibacter sp.]|nr:DNA-processing protein DprA [Flavisolibacter sp.]
MSELLYQLSLTLVPNIGDVHAKILLEYYGSASAIFKAKKAELEGLEGIGAVRAASIRSFKDFKAAEREIGFIEKYGIQTLSIRDSHYPQRLLNCYDAPSLLFYKGTANLNASRIIGIVGTRSSSDYGRSVTEKLVRDLSEQEVLIASGLAFGIDATAHKASLQNNLPTVGVVGHGLGSIYPAEHAGLAKEMIRTNGGILSEFFSQTKPDKHNFPLRNRLVAGLCDAIVVVETGVKGGSMITAKLADGYNRDVFAVPGRTIDKASTGCNYLIKHQKAQLLTDADSLLEVMGWKAKPKATKKQRTLFTNLSEDEQKLLQLFEAEDKLHIDNLNLRSGLSCSTVAACLLNLELQGIVESLPGKQYRVY